MIIYLALIIAGVLLLIVSFIFGEIFDFLDFDIGGDGGSSSIIAIGMVAFGAGGLLATGNGLSVIPSVLIAAACAVALGALAAWLLSIFYKGSAGTEDDFITARGRVGQVTTAIGADSPGEVLITSAGSTRQRLARSVTGEPIPDGAFVRVVDIAGNTFLVEPMTQTEAALESKKEAEA